MRRHCCVYLTWEHCIILGNYICSVYTDRTTLRVSSYFLIYSVLLPERAQLSATFPGAKGHQQRCSSTIYYHTKFIRALLSTKTSFPARNGEICTIYNEAKLEYSINDNKYIYSTFMQCGF